MGCKLGLGVYVNGGDFNITGTHVYVQQLVSMCRHSHNASMG